MAKRSIRKRRHRFWSAFAAMVNRADAQFVSQAAAYERWFEAMGASMLGAIDDRNAALVEGLCGRVERGDL